MDELSFESFHMQCLLEHSTEIGYNDVEENIVFHLQTRNKAVNHVFSPKLCQLGVDFIVENSIYIVLNNSYNHHFYYTLTGFR